MINNKAIFFCLGLITFFLSFSLLTKNAYAYPCSVSADCGGNCASGCSEAYCYSSGCACIGGSCVTACYVDCGGACGTVRCSSCGNQEDCGPCPTTSPVTPTPTPTPVPPGIAGCDTTTCGAPCGYKNADGSCTTSGSCCHRVCSGCNSCVTVEGGGSNLCDNGADCGSCVTPPPGSTPTPASSNCYTNTWETVANLNNVGCNYSTAASFWTNVVRLTMTGGGGGDQNISYYCCGSGGSSWRTADGATNHVTNQSGAIHVNDVRTTANFGIKRVTQQNISVGCNDGESANFRVDRCVPEKTAGLSLSSSSVQYGSPVTVNYSGISYAANQPVRLWVERKGSAQISPAPGTEGYYAGKYYYQIDSCSNAVGDTCNGSKAVTLPMGDYYFHVDVGNDPLKCSGNPFCPYEGCPKTAGDVCTTCTGWRSCSATDNASFTVTTPPNGTIEGRIIHDVTANYIKNPNTCTNGEYVENVYISITGQSVALPNSCDGSNNPYYTTGQSIPASLTNGNYNVSVNYPSNWAALSWTCSSSVPGSCPAASGNGRTASNISVPAGGTVNLDFHVKYEPDAWLQTQGGDVHAQGALNSDIPFTVPAVSRLFSLDLDSYPGIVSYGSIDSTPFGEGWSSSKQWQANSLLTPEKSSYDYFYDLLESPTTPIDCAGLRNNTMPGNGFYLAVLDPTTGSCDLSNSLNFGNRKIVIFVNGDLVLGSGINRIEVDRGASGGFLAFIVRGNILISGEIGDKVATDPYPVDSAHLQGMYIAEGIIDSYDPPPTGGGDGSKKRLVGAGLFYAKGGYSLDRNLYNDLSDPIINSRQPAELFIFRPDLVINAPRQLWLSKMSWLEVAP